MRSPEVPNQPSPEQYKKIPILEIITGLEGEFKFESLAKNKLLAIRALLIKNGLGEAKIRENDRFAVRSKIGDDFSRSAEDILNDLRKDFI